VKIRVNSCKASFLRFGAWDLGFVWDWQPAHSALPIPDSALSENPLALDFGL
jgi:hypothetical protein